MFERKIDRFLREWADDADKKCLLVRGKKRVGKTTSIRELGKSYGSYIEVNFKSSSAGSKIFSCDPNIDYLKMMFAVYMPEAVFIPGETLLFLDDIEDCPEAMRSLPAWYEDGRFDVVAAGSDLGVGSFRPEACPEWAVTCYDMHSMSFEEFLWANGQQEKVIESLKLYFMSRKKVPDPVNFKFMELLRIYMALGGMPEVVETYVSGGSVRDWKEKQLEILEDYRSVMPPYAAKCLFSLPEQLSKENRKFQYSIVEKGQTARKYGKSLDYLLKADFGVASDNVTVVKAPLKEYKEQGNFRLYSADIGLFTAMCDFEEVDRLFRDTYDKRSVFAGHGLYEALIADILYKNGHNDLYFKKETKGTFEMEFLIEENGQAVPVEVKPRDSRSRSMGTALMQDDIPYGYKLTDGNIEGSGKKITLPLYMAMFL